MTTQKHGDTPALIFLIIGFPHLRLIGKVSSIALFLQAGVAGTACIDYIGPRTQLRPPKVLRVVSEGWRHPVMRKSAKMTAAGISIGESPTNDGSISDMI